MLEVLLPGIKDFDAQSYKKRRGCYVDLGDCETVSTISGSADSTFLPIDRKIQFNDCVGHVIMKIVVMMME